VLETGRFVVHGFHLDKAMNRIETLHGSIKCHAWQCTMKFILKARVKYISDSLLEHNVHHVTGAIAVA
jgi:hypothetical protein